MSDFYNIYLKVREKDLEFFKSVLDALENDCDNLTIDNIVSESIFSVSYWLDEYKSQIQKLYTKAGIIYTAEEDPFTVFKSKYENK